MREWGARQKARWRESRGLRRKWSAVGGFAATVLFALYNGALGLYHASPWHGSICVYYLLLSALRGALLDGERRRQRSAAPRSGRGRSYLTAAMMLLMNATLAAPVALMVLDARRVQTGMIPAIATATYTTYKITAAAVKLKRKAPSVFLRQLNLLGFVDALVSILVLQNTLITAAGGGIREEMFLLSAITSGGIYLLILVLSLLWLIRGAKERVDAEITP